MTNVAENYNVLLNRRVNFFSLLCPGRLAILKRRKNWHHEGRWVRALQAVLVM